MAAILLAGCGHDPVEVATPPTGKPPPPVPAVPVRPTTLTVVGSGDLLVHPPLTEQAAADARAAGRSGHDFTRVFAEVVPVIQTADLAICHLEQPLGEPEGPFTGYPIFSAPPQLADAAAEAGFDACSTASNHSLDNGMAGVARTLNQLDRVGIAHAGTARTAVEASIPTVLDVRGVPVGHISYTFSFNGLPLPEDVPWAANLIDPAKIRAEAKLAREAGAEIVIASLHWGTEYQVAADAGQLGLARELLAGPELDLIIGHHAHVVQPFERVSGKWVAYGLGNLITRFPDGSAERFQDSALPRFTFVEDAPGEWRVTKVEVVGTFMDYYPDARVVDLPVALAKMELSSDQRDRYRRSLERITRQVSQRGAAADGLQMVTPEPAGPEPAE